MRAHLESVVLVTDDAAADAVRFLLLRMKLLVEPSGAAPLAALMAARFRIAQGKKIGVVLSGGNIDAGKLAGILKSHESLRHAAD
jgi:threonine dehydratase